jgi:hypothetical protein
MHQGDSLAPGQAGGRVSNRNPRNAAGPPKPGRTWRGLDAPPSLVAGMFPWLEGGPDKDQGERRGCNRPHRAQRPQNQGEFSKALDFVG